jgi:hypothetical protein
LSAVAISQAGLPHKYHVVTSLHVLTEAVFYHIVTCSDVHSYCSSATRTDLKYSLMTVFSVKLGVLLTSHCPGAVVCRFGVRLPCCA